MRFKVFKNVSHDDLIKRGFTYRPHFDDYCFIITQPKTQREYEHLLNMGFTHKHIEDDKLTSHTNLDYNIIINLNTKEVEMFTQALNNYPYKELKHQHTIAEEFIIVITSLVAKNIIDIDYIDEETQL